MNSDLRSKIITVRMSQQTDYVIYNTSYVDRIGEDSQLLKQLLDKIKDYGCRLVFMKTYGGYLSMFNESGGRVEKSEEAQEIIDAIEEGESFPTISGICVTYRSPLALIKIHNVLVDLDYCANLDSIFDAQQRGDVLILQYDTESG